MFKGKTILVAPLDWGLGHATRCVPLVRQLSAENIVILGSTPLLKPLFDEEFPELKQVALPAYDISYSKLLPLWLKLSLDSPRITKVIADEHRILGTLADELKPDVVISDSRFGFHTEKAQSVFITHQLFLKSPVLNPIAQNINKNYILKFDEVWVPDYEEAAKSLSGELSHAAVHFHDNVKYIGPQSRLAEGDPKTAEQTNDILILLSGPEPERSTLEEALLEKFKNTDKKIVLVRGTQKENSRQLAVRAPGIRVYDFPAKYELRQLILSSQKIICRSGYSTLMDLHLLGKKNLLLVPTPGQTEQEYLADYWKKHFGAETIAQDKISGLRI
ncbi:MAG: glycosyltransferase [Bacteroidia bacterium]